MSAIFAYVRRAPSSTKHWSGSQYVRVWMLLGLFACGCRESPQIRTFPLVVAEDQLDLGAVWPQSDFEHEVTLRNVSDREVDISQLASSCTCTVVHKHPESIPAHGSVSLRFRLNLLWGEPTTDDANNPARAFKASFSVGAIRADRNNHVWHLRGIILRPFSLDSPGVHFTDTVIQGSSSPLQEVTLTPHVPLAGIEASVDNHTLNVSVSKGHSGEYRALVRPGKDLPLGRFTSEIRFTGVTRDGTKLPTRKLVADGVVVQDLFAIPASVCLPIWPSPSSAVDAACETIVIQSRSGTSFSVGDVHLEPPNTFHISPLDSPAEASATRRAAFQVRRIGRQSDVEHSRDRLEPMGRIVFEIVTFAPTEAKQILEVPIL